MTSTLSRAPVLATFAAAAICGVMLSSAALAAVTAGPAVPANNGGMGNGGPVSVQVKGDIQYAHFDGFKGAKKVAISVFNVAFPDENVQTAKTKQVIKYRSLSAIGTPMENTITNTKSEYQHTLIRGIDHATRQRIADAAYADFVAQLTKQGYEVVDADALAKLAPEYTTWTAEPNFSQGRFGEYVAPTGRKVYWLTGDKAKRNSGSGFAQQFNALAMQERTQAYNRSPYLAAAADLGVIAVTLVIDYGTYVNTGDTKKFNAKMEVSFDGGVVAQAGSNVGPATMTEYWGPKSGGFPAIALMLTPLKSDLPFGDMDNGGNGDGEVIITAKPALFEKAAAEVAQAANAKLIGAMAAAR